MSNRKTPGEVGYKHLYKKCRFWIFEDDPDKLFDRSRFGRFVTG
jgi:hypothetical protein